MKRLMIAAALLCGFGAIMVTMIEPAFAQRKPESVLTDDEKVKRREADAVDRQYQSAIERTRKDGAAAQVDPWSNLRGASTDKKK